MSLEAQFRILESRVVKLTSVIGAQQAQINSLLTRPKTITEEIDSIPGRRIDTVLSGEVSFTIDQQGVRGNPIVIQVSQDGPFIMTHYPMAIWRPTLPTNTTNFMRWRPVTTFPLPDQVVDTDIIDLMYELQDGGAQRNFQNAPRGPLLSRPDNIVPAAVPTQWAPNAAIVFVPIYNRITWDSNTPPTQGVLHVDFPGYRIVNL